MVSIIIPVYNSARYLDDCLNSVIEQNYKDIEIIIINDGSTDNSLEIANQFKQKDNRIKVYSQENQGQSSARNKGIEKSSRDFILFVDSDDMIDENCVQECLKRMQSDDLDIVFFDAANLIEHNYRFEDNYIRTKIFDESVISGPDFLEREIKKNALNYSPVMLMLKRNLLIKNRISFYEGIIHEDVLFHYHIFGNALRVSYLPKGFYKRRIRANSTVTKTKNSKNTKAYKTIFFELWHEAKIKTELKDVFYYECSRRFLLTISTYLTVSDKTDKKKIKSHIQEMIKIAKNRKILFFRKVIQTLFKKIISTTF